MRTITQIAVNKFLKGETFRKDNTEVWVGYEFTTQRVSRLLLHDNEIATKENGVIKIDNCGWFSTTTKERLNGLLKTLGRIGIQQKNFKWYLDGKEWNGREVTLLPNNDWQYVSPYVNS